MKTGDMGTYDQDGRVAYVDRIKAIIKYNNNHVSPTEIENLLQEHPALAESLVFGEKDPTVQELISAVIVLKENKHFKCQADVEEIKKFVNDQITIDFKKIRGDIIIRDSIPRNSNGKMLRKWAENEMMEEHAKRDRATTI
jgi:acyl-CoA synthetase (AMP-forming)/AMP-acid ligase II